MPSVRICRTDSVKSRQRPGDPQDKDSQEHVTRAKDNELPPAARIFKFGCPKLGHRLENLISEIFGQQKYPGQKPTERNDTKTDQPELYPLLKDFCQYFVRDMEAILTFYNTILKNNKRSVIKNMYSILYDKFRYLLDLIKDCAHDHVAENLAWLLIQLDDRETRIELRKVMVKACCELFYSFEMQFMSSSHKKGEQRRAMHMLAKDAVIRVLKYYLQESVRGSFDVAVITRAVTHNFKQDVKNTVKEAIFDNMLDMHTGCTIKLNCLDPKTSSFNSSDMYSQVGIIKSDDIPFEYYKTKLSKPSKYGYRRLFGWERENLHMLPELQLDTYKGHDYNFMVRYEELDVFSAKICKYINDQGVERMRKVRRDVIRLSKKLIHMHKDSEKRHVIVIEKIEEMKKERSMKETTKNCDIRISAPVTPFAGREKEIQDIHSAINKGMVVVSGLAGMGKTELVREYARRYKDYFNENILWIDAETSETLTQYYYLHAQRLGIAVNEDEKPKHQSIIVNEVYRKFNDTNALFIFDNVHSQSVIKQFLPTLSDGQNIKVLLTSQLQEWHQAKIILLGVLSKREAVKLVIDNLSEYVTAQEDEVVALVDAVQYFPLALQQAIAYIIDQVRTNCLYRISDYVKKLQTEGDLLLGYKFDDCVFPKYFNNTYTKTTFHTISLALDQLKAEQTEPELSISLLNAIAYMEPPSIEKDLFLGLMNEESLNKEVRALRKYSLITDSNGYIEVHQLVQQVLRFIAKRNGTDKTHLSQLLIVGLTSKLWLSTSGIEQFTSVLKYATTYPNLILDTFKALARPIKIKLVLSLCKFGYYDFFSLGRCNNRIDFLMLFIAKGANCNLQDRYQKTPGGNLTELKTTNHTGETAQHVAVINKATIAARKLIDGVGNIHHASPDIWTNLHYAVQVRNLHLIKHLLDKGADVNCKDVGGDSPLHCAIQMHNNNTIQFLLDNGADVNVKNVNGRTALHKAASCGYISICKLLHSYKADVNAQDIHLRTPLHYAAKCKFTNVTPQASRTGKHPVSHEELVRTFLQLGADLEARSSSGNTPLHEAIICGHVNVALLLISRGASVNCRCEMSFMLLHEVALSDFKKREKTLMAQERKRERDYGDEDDDDDYDDYDDYDYDDDDDDDDYDDDYDYPDDYDDQNVDCGWYFD